MDEHALIGRDAIARMVVTNQTPPRAGDLIGRNAAGYIIEALIGEGGMGAVYRGFCPLAGQRAAIKVLLAEYTENPEVVERFKAEVRAAAAVDDPNIIDIYAADVFPDGRMFIVMRFVEGGSLEALCRGVGPLPLDTAAAIGLQVCSGLDSLHAAAIVHRDIKAQNILVTPRHGRKYFVSIVDLGIAKLLAPHLAPGYKTRTKAVLGTAGCMAPEQARGDRDVDARADIYSLGMVLYRMLTGRPVYEGHSLYALIEQQITNAPFPRPRQLRPEIPPVWDDLIMTCLEFDRARRPKSMREVASPLASGIEHGPQLLQALAPRLMTQRPIGAQAATLTGDLESSIKYWTSSPLPRPRSRTVSLAVTAVAGAVLGGATIKLIGRTAPEPTRVSFERQVASGAVLPADAAPAQIAVAASSRSDAALPAALTFDAAPPAIDAAPVAESPAHKAPPRPDPAATIAESPAHPASPRPDPAATGKTGILVVAVTPYAEVFVDDIRVGTTPVRQSLSVGPHRLRLVGADSHEELVVKISPGKETDVKRKW